MAYPARGSFDRFRLRDSPLLSRNKTHFRNVAIMSLNLYHFQFVPHSTDGSILIRVSALDTSSYRVATGLHCNFATTQKRRRTFVA